ncbi:MAG TPA: exonuclease domain-containing protein [Candidatus Eisenbacteria bacterium]|nr:exonuclease domain-containing protein [Candidatus Eisenbacteria bacterium]
MRQRLYDYLLERPAGATPDELSQLVFTSPGRDREFAHRIVALLLDADARFHFDEGRGRWTVRDHELLARPLAETAFVVVDLETTGRAPGATGITEIGAVRVQGGRLHETFATLVNPGHPIPPFISGLTGITDEMVAGAPPIADALRGFLAFAGDAILVAHNAAFDMGHLNAARRALEGRAVDLPAVCTLRLARRLQPELERKGLDSVASALGIGIVDRHRGLGDARITAEVLCVFLEQLAARGVTRVGDLLAFQRQAPDGEPWEVHVPLDRLADVPPTPGVYRLLDEDGRLLYVGRARRLRDRLASYFASPEGHSSHTLALVRLVHDFTIVETGSELAAALLEARLIHDERPPRNRNRRHLPRLGFLKLNPRSAAPRLAVTHRLGTDRALYLGPLDSIDLARRAQETLARAFGLRTRISDPPPDPNVYPSRVESFRAFAEGRADLMAGDLTEADRATLTTMRDRLAARARIVTRQNYVVLLPTVAREEAQLYVVLGGRLAFESRLGADGDLRAAMSVIRERFGRYQSLPLERADVEATTVLAGWLRDRRREGIFLPFDDPGHLEEQLDQLTVTLHDLRQRGPLPAIDGLR